MWLEEGCGGGLLLQTQTKKRRRVYIVGSYNSTSLTTASTQSLPLQGQGIFISSTTLKQHQNLPESSNILPIYCEV